MPDGPAARIRPFSSGVTPIGWGRPPRCGVFRRRVFLLLAGLIVVFVVVPSATAQRRSVPDLRGNDSRPVVANQQPKEDAAGKALFGLPQGLDVDEMLSPSGMPSTLKIMLLLTVLSLAPSMLIMTTCFIRFVIVFGLLRQALGTQQLPPNQVIVSLCLFLTFLVMAPVWQQAYDEGIKPYANEEPIPGLKRGEDPLKRTFLNTVRPLRKFMSDQIEKTGNSDSVWMFLEFQHRNADENQPPWEEKYRTYDDVPLTALLPAYMLSELKTAFVIGFQIYLPFLVIDMVVASVLISMGMMMLPPVLISLPFKLLLFVLIDGWFLTVGMLLESVQPFS
ncbi:MAG: flagellar type III secretion system pore protein FliP [Planctomycetes bacterium]|nr:flagellar type III secretion system pore protein FliP [Planctomycetota bacterium]